MVSRERLLCTSYLQMIFGFAWIPTGMNPYVALMSVVDNETRLRNRKSNRKRLNSENDAERTLLTM